jgi:ribosomal RNA assembly protein
METTQFDLKIPQERVAVLIGKAGSTKRELETKLECELQIDSEEGDVQITAPNPIDVLVAKDVVRAVGRGFNPDIAILLKKDDFVLEIISLADFNQKKNHQERLKGRVIGRDGKARNIIEEHTECHISVYGKTVGIIGPAENVRIAYKAVTSLLNGSPHAYVYKWLERQRFTLHQPETIELKENIAKKETAEDSDSDEKNL